MVHNRQPSVRTIHEESSNEGNAALSGGGSSRIPNPHACNVVTLIPPVTTTPLPENALALLTTPTIPLWTAAPQLGTEFLLEQQQQAYQEEQQACACARQIDVERRAA
jgi:hypothetical protein